MGFKYRGNVLEELSRHGVIPLDDTPPELIHEFVNALYVFEIRQLKTQMLAGKIPKVEYASHIEALRRRYPILSLAVRFWIEPE
jgi:hypothetical protein